MNQETKNKLIEKIEEIDKLCQIKEDDGLKVSIEVGIILGLKMAYQIIIEDN